jgi:ketosteroid isomerase-like protein
MPFKVGVVSGSRSWLWVLFALLCLNVAAAQAKSGMPRAVRHESRHEIDQLEDTWKDAVVHRNIQTMDKLLSDDYIAISANGTLQSKDQALDNLKNGKVQFKSIDLSDRKVRFYGQTALVTSRAEISGNTEEGDVSGGYRFTRVYVRDEHGDWKIVSFEASRIRDTGEHSGHK